MPTITDNQTIIVSNVTSVTSMFSINILLRILRTLLCIYLCFGIFLSKIFLMWDG